ncbi:MAG: phosphoribosylanthranilate isomerase [Gluconacetobacter diazotrophicus]|nr:phosphoribosylanthranilate isomerase [Gluconacetobacter diazotrophicus]
MSAHDPVAVKICGLRDRDTLEAALDSGADWIGLVFHARSPRHVDPDTAATLSGLAAGRAGRVGLFVRPGEAELAEVLSRVELDALQLYGMEDRIGTLRERFGLPVWCAHGVATAADLPCRSDADRLVIEAKPPAGTNRPGGNGARFDWDLAAGWVAPRPWLLAGGLNPDNVAEAIRRSGARTVDVSSGVEEAPGLKDPALIRRFIAAARGTAAGRNPQ